MIDADAIVSSAETDVSDDDTSTGVQEVMQDVVSDDVVSDADDDSSDGSSKDAPAVDDRTPAVLRLERAQRLKREGEIARAEHDAAAIATDQKTARLKALRLEREAADRVVAAKEAAAKAELKPAAKRKRVAKAPA